MDDISDLIAHYRLDGQHGFFETGLPGVTIIVANKSEGSCPQLYDRGMTFILSGSKIGKIKDLTFQTGPDQFVMLASASPIQCETMVQSDESLYGLYVKPDLADIRRIAEILDHHNLLTGDGSHANNRIVSPCRMTTPIREALLNLVQTLSGAARRDALGKAAIDRLLYEVLQQPEASGLIESVRAGNKLARVTKAMMYMEENLAEKITVEELADLSGLSLAAFHRAFKDATGDSPLQFLKKLRLSQARNLLVYKGHPAFLAAHDVGYESPAQFSREFKRYFGVPPSRAKDLPYAEMEGVI